jgi:hypothetical protein
MSYEALHQYFRTWLLPFCEEAIVGLLVPDYTILLDGVSDAESVQAAETNLKDALRMCTETIEWSKSVSKLYVFLENQCGSLTQTQVPLAPSPTDSRSKTECKILVLGEQRDRIIHSVTRSGVLFELVLVSEFLALICN